MPSIQKLSSSTCLMLSLMAAEGATTRTDQDASGPASLEIRVAPPEVVYLNEAGRLTGLTDLILQNVAVANTGVGDVRLDAMEIVALREGLPVVTNTIDFDAYQDAWTRMRARYEQPGVMHADDSIYSFSELLREGESLAPSTTLQPRSCILVTKQVLTFVSWQRPEAIEIRLWGSAAGGGVVDARADLRVALPSSRPTYDLPLRGRWYVSSSSSLNSHHRIRPAHEFALDFVRIGEGGRSHRGDGTSVEDYYAYGQPVLAVDAGKVVRAVDGVPDTDLPRKGESRAAFAARVLGPMWESDPSGAIASGNIIVIEHAGGEYSTYAHLKPGSLRVQTGTPVLNGQTIAEVGFSGDAFEPHLHFQVNQGPDPQYSRGLPVRFGNVRPVAFASTHDMQGRRQYMKGEFLETAGDDDGSEGDPRSDISQAELAAALKAELDRLREEYGFPGGTAAVALPDGHCLAVATGLADVEGAVPMQPEHRMLMGSIGKTFVAALATKLHLERRLDLDAGIAKWFGDEPWFSRLPNHEHITLRMLLNHSAGIQNHAWRSEVVDAVRDTLDPTVAYAPTHAELVSLILDSEPLFAAGKGFEYTDTGYILAGWIIERATGREYYEVLQSELLDRLGLKDIVPANTRSIPMLAAGYVGESPTLRLPHKVAGIGRLYYDPTFEWTGGGLASTASDLALWGQRLYEGSAIIGDYLDEILDSTAERPPIEDLPSIGPYAYGLGVYLAESPFGPLVGHGGVMFGYTSRMRHLVDHGFTLAIQVNRFHFGDDMQAYILALGAVVVEHLDE